MDVQKNNNNKSGRVSLAEEVCCERGNDSSAGQTSGVSVHSPREEEGDLHNTSPFLRFLGCYRQGGF